MTLTGTRDDWEALTKEDDRALSLKPSHVATIQEALAAASPDADAIEVDAGFVALRQTVGRIGDASENPTRTIAEGIADADETWWLIRAHMLGLDSIRPVPPWPRQPKRYIEAEPEVGGPFATG